jgi:hypothetical protein
MKLINSTTTTSSSSLAKSMLIYGETQSGKTSLLGAIARAHHKRTGKITRLILLDEGGTSAIEPEVHDGIIQVLDMVGDEQVQSNLLWLAKGCWPGECWPKGGKLPKDTTNEEGIPLGLDKVGIIAIDSITAVAKSLMQNFLDTGENVASKREEQGITISRASQGNYGDVHKGVLQLISRFYSLPVDKVIYTALESKGEDTVDKSIVLGPMTEGKAITGVVPSRMNRLLHLEIVASPDKGRVYRIYFQPHIDKALGKVWPANLRLPLSKQAEFKAHPIYGKGYLDFETGEELLKLLDYCEELVKPRAEEKDKTAMETRLETIKQPMPEAAPTPKTGATTTNQATALLNKSTYPSKR